MTTSVYLHVGSPKSGTTYLQQILRANRSRLADRGVLVAGERHVDLIHAAMAVREDPRLSRLPARRQASWTKLVADVRSWHGDSAVISYELFAGASEEHAAAALRGLAGLDVHVVITARDLAQAVPSAWQERLKFGLVTPLEQWRPPPETDERSEWGWRTLDPAGVAARWGAQLPPERIHVVTVPRTNKDPHELWHRFAQACGLGGDAVDLDVARVNESLGVVQAELLRRVNRTLRAQITSNREQAIWLRDLLAHEVLAAAPHRDPIGITDEQYAEAVATADQAVAVLAERGYSVHGDLEDIRATRADGARRPGDVGDTELLGAAVEAIGGLLLAVRAREGATAAAPTDQAGAGARSAAGRLLRRASGRFTDRRQPDLRERIRRLEAEVATSRALQLRVASLQDVVTELLLPSQARDGEITTRALRAYRQASM